MVGAKGQSLLELTIALGIVVVIVSALAILTTKSLQNSQFAQNQAFATQWAQEAITQVRAIKNQNGYICKSGNVAVNWNSMWTADCSGLNSCLYKVVSNDTCGGSISTLTNYLQQINNTTTDPETKTLFSRWIVVDNVDANQKKATAWVTWSDALGTHQSELSTYLANI